MTATQPTLEAMLDNPDLVIGLATKLKQQREENARLVEANRNSVVRHISPTELVVKSQGGTVLSEGRNLPSSDLVRVTKGGNDDNPGWSRRNETLHRGVTSFPTPVPQKLGRAFKAPPSDKRCKSDVYIRE